MKFCWMHALNFDRRCLQPLTQQQLFIPECYSWLQLKSVTNTISCNYRAGISAAGMLAVNARGILTGVAYLGQRLLI
jgi:hypothetical protein